MWVRPQPQRARCGSSRAVAPSSSRITRSRPRPHRFRRPVPHEGQVSSPPARPADAAAGSAHSSTECLPDHDGRDARTRARPPGGTRVGGCQAGRRPATRTARSGGTLWPPAGHGLSPVTSTGSPGAGVAHEKGHSPAAPDQHAHAERRQPPFQVLRKSGAKQVRRVPAAAAIPARRQPHRRHRPEQTPDPPRLCCGAHPRPAPAGFTVAGRPSRRRSHGPVGTPGRARLAGAGGGPRLGDEVVGQDGHLVALADRLGGALGEETERGDLDPAGGVAAGDRAGRSRARRSSTPAVPSRVTNLRGHPLFVVVQVAAGGVHRGPPRHWYSARHFRGGCSKP